MDFLPRPPSADAGGSDASSISQIEPRALTIAFEEVSDSFSAPLIESGPHSTIKRLSETLLVRSNETTVTSCVALRVEIL